MNSHLKNTHFFLILTFFFPFVLSQTQDSCNSPLTLQSPIPFETTSLHCVNVWSSQNFILRYAQAAPNVWSFLLSAPNTNGYIGMGFSSNGNMVGSRAIVGWVGVDGTTDMKKYFLGGKFPNLVTLESTDQGLQIRNSSMVFQSNQIYMAFQLVSDNPTTRLLYSVGQMGRLPSGPNFRLTEHRTMISTFLNYATGQFQTQTRPEAKLRRTHGILNMLGWGILLPIGVLVARHMRKWDPLWFYSHAGIQTFGFALGFSGVICGLVLESRLDASVSKHKALGIFILVLGCLQVMALLIRPDKASKVRKYWNWYHFSVGRVLILIAAANVFYGIHLGNAGSGWNAGYAIALAILFIIALVLELRMCLRK